ALEAHNYEDAFVAPEDSISANQNRSEITPRKSHRNLQRW
ncbi:6659_t:CDS:2, partial [Scutellospora calospora]